MSIKDLVDAGKYLASLGYVEGREGNLSVRVDGGFYVKATNAFMSDMTEQDYVFVDMDGRHQGERPPSSEYRMHLAIYRMAPWVNYVVHTHPVYSLSVAEATGRIDLLHSEAKIYFKKGISVLPYIEPGTQELADAVALKVKDGYEAVLLKLHGLVTVGETLDVALMRTVSVEKSAKIFFFTSVLKR